MFFSIFLNMTVYCELSLELPHRDDSNDYTQYTIFNIIITLHYPKYAAMGFFQGTQERVISVRATEGLLYFHLAAIIMQTRRRRLTGNKTFVFF